MSGSIGQLPGYIYANISEFGFSGALAMAQTQQMGADTTAAFNYYSAIVSALQAISTEMVTIPTFGGSVSANYSYAVATRPSLAVKSTVSLWVYGVATVPPIAATGGLGVLYGRATLPPIRVLH